MRYRRTEPKKQDPYAQMNRADFPEEQRVSGCETIGIQVPAGSEKLYYLRSVGSHDRHSIATRYTKFPQCRCKAPVHVQANGDQDEWA